MVFPAAKLASVALRQISKPLAAAMLSQAKQNKKFGYICVSFANWYSRLEYRITRNFYDRNTKSTFVPKLDENRAIELGTTVFGETIVFAVAAIAIGFEYRRSQLKESMKEQKLQDDLAAIKRQLGEVRAENNRFNSLIDSLSAGTRQNSIIFPLKTAPEELGTSKNKTQIPNKEQATCSVASLSNSNLTSDVASRRNDAEKEENNLIYSPSGVAVTPSKNLTVTHLPSGVIVKRLATDVTGLPEVKNGNENIDKS